VNVNLIAAQLGLTIKQGHFPDPNISGLYNKDELTINVATRPAVACLAYSYRIV
jgi:hypothetical protein